MAFLRLQGVVLGEGRVAIKGSAALVASQYVKPGPEQKYHSRQIVLEKLGKVLWLSEDKRTGIFNSPTRGLVEYRVDDNAFTSVGVEDERIDGVDMLKVKPEQHTTFADVHWLMTFLQQSGHAQVLEEAFPDRKLLARLYVHIAHTILKNGGKESCKYFATKSVISHFFQEISLSSLKSDSPFFHGMGQDHVRIDYFKAYVSHMRKHFPEFGHGCYVDSTPLPNEIKANVFKQVGNHGTDGPQEQSRLALVLDKATGKPTWYKLFAGNINDINTLETIISDVKDSIDISLDSFVLDAGYVSKDLIGKMCEDKNKDFIGRAPARLGFHYTTLFTQQV